MMKQDDTPPTEGEQTEGSSSRKRIESNQIYFSTEAKATLGLWVGIKEDDITW
jgi:hypothetical protein